MKNQSQLRIAESGPSPAISLASAHTLTEQVLARLREDIPQRTACGVAEAFGCGNSPHVTGEWERRRCVKPWHGSQLTAWLPMRATGEFRVASVSVAEFLDVTENRKRIEGLALERSIEAGDDAWEGRVLADYHQLRKLEASHRSNSKLNDPAFDWERRHRNFHQALISACRHPGCC